MKPSPLRLPLLSPTARVFSHRAAMEVALGLGVMLAALLMGPPSMRPWALAVPVGLGLVHGFAAALWGALLALALGPLQLGQLWLGTRAAGIDVSLVWPLLALCAGELRDRLVESRARAEQNERAARAALERLSRTHETLQSSHAALETALGAEGWSLEAGVRELERMARSGAEPRAQADALLALCAAHVGVSRAAVYLVSRGKLDSAPLACLGQQGRGRPGALAARAIEDLRLVFVASREASPESGVAALPLTDARGAVLGVLVIDAVPFARLHRRELGLLRALGGRFADGLAGLSAAEAEAPVRLNGVRPLADAMASLPPVPVALAHGLSAPMLRTSSEVRRAPDAPGSGVHLAPLPQETASQQKQAG